MHPGQMSTGRIHLLFGLFLVGIFSYPLLGIWEITCAYKKRSIVFLKNEFHTIQTLLGKLPLTKKAHKKSLTSKSKV
jgi:hypothetical protein